MTAFTDIENEEAPLVPAVTGPGERRPMAPVLTGLPDPFERALQEDAE